MLAPCLGCGKPTDSRLAYCDFCRKAIEDGGLAYMGVKRIKYICINKDRGWFESKYDFQCDGFGGVKVWIYVDMGYGIVGRS